MTSTASTIGTQEQELTWGGFVLESSAPTDVPWTCRTLATLDFGSPQPIIEVLKQTLLYEGAEAQVTGWDNREDITVEVRISAADGQAMAQAEHALFAQVRAERPAPLHWTPPMGGAWPGAFDIVVVRYRRKYDVAGGWDYREKHLQHRVYVLEFTALPFVRDLEPVVVPALPAPAEPDEPVAYEALDECTSAAGWTAIRCHEGCWNAVPVVDSSGTWVRAYASNKIRTGLGFLGLTRPGSLSLDGMPYLTVDISTRSNPLTHGPAEKITLVQGGQEHAPVALEPRPDGTTRHYFTDLPDTITKPQIRAYWNVSKAIATRWVVVHEYGRTNRVAIDKTNGLQVSRIITVEGAAPTGAAIRLDAGDEPLFGSTAMIYTGPSDVVRLRPLITESVAPVTDDTMMSGAYNDLATPTKALVPVTSLTDSTYDLLAKLRFTGTARVRWSARLVTADGTNMPGSDVVHTDEILLRNPTTDPWRIHTLTSLRLPIVPVEGTTTHQIEIKIWMDTGGAAVRFDEGWLADTGRGALTIVHEPSAFQLSAIELRSPHLDAPKLAVVGTWLEYGTQDITRLAKLGRHRFDPGPLYIFTATDLARYAACSARYYRRYPDHPGPPLPATPPALLDVESGS